jgi:hypothetical protein
LPNAAWQAPQQVTTLAGSYQTPRIAVSDSGMHLLLTDYYGLFYFLRSTDGNSWDSVRRHVPVVITNANYAELRADADNAYVVYNQYTPPELSRMFFTKVYKNDATFSTPVQIFTNQGYKTTVYVKDFDVAGQPGGPAHLRPELVRRLREILPAPERDAGLTWSGGEQPGQGAHLALRPATGSISYIAPDIGPGGRRPVFPVQALRLAELLEAGLRQCLAGRRHGRWPALDR